MTIENSEITDAAECALPDVDGAGAGAETGVEAEDGAGAEAEGETGVEAEGETGVEAGVETPALSSDEIRGSVEAILTVADEPLSLVAIATAVGQPVAIVRRVVASLVADYNGEDDATARVRRGFELREVGGGWRLYVRGDYDQVVSEFVAEQHPSRLSQAALETLAVIAYKQPVTRSQVAQVRAVNVDSVVRTLLGRGLIEELFTDTETGAINYGTSELLLTQLGINSIEQLPPISPLLDDGAAGFDDVS